MNVQGNPLRERTSAGFWRTLSAALLLSQSAVTVSYAASVVAWGADDSGQTDLPSNLTNIVAVAAGASHSVALSGNGTVIAWGFNASGQTSVPTNLTAVASIAAGAAYSMALQSNGTVVVWGSQTAAPASATNVTAIAAGWYHSLALRKDGTVVSWGTLTTVPAGLANVVAIAAGNGSSLALRLDGTIVAWGDNTYGQTNVPAAASSNVVGIAAGQYHCLALLRNGAVVAWGRNNSGQATVPANLTTAVAVSGGAAHSLVLKADGTLAAWGDNSFGQSTVSTNDSGFIGISAGGYHNLALKGDGTPYILVQPGSQTVVISKNATLQVLATGAQPLLFQWYHNNNLIVGQTNDSLTLINVQSTNGGNYTVTVANSFNTITSLPATITPVGEAPVVTVPPRNTTAICGDPASFQVTVDGSAPFTYQWWFGGAPITGATKSSLTLNNVNLGSAGAYSVAVTNAYGSTITGAVLTVTVQPPQITSPLSASATQGQPFTYQITGLHSPVKFGAGFLPSGLTINTNTGVISGIPAEYGVFGAMITAINACSSDTETLVITVGPGLPVITSVLTASGTEESPFSYQITATGSPTTFGAQNLPAGLSVDSSSGIISGTPTFSGNYSSTIWASNTWGMGSATLQFSLASMFIPNINIGNVTYNYSSPYLLDFQFSLYTVLGDTNDPAAPHSGVVVDPTLLSAITIEDGVTNSTTEGGYFLTAGNSKVVKIFLVLDFTESIASPANGVDSNGVSLAVDYEVAGAIDFVNQLPSGVQVGVYEFHRDDYPPNKVVGLTTDKNLLASSIGGIWTNYVQNFSSGSRCWDAVGSAITGLGTNNVDEQHSVVFVSDGSDSSSTNTLQNILIQATNNAVKIYSVGFGVDLDTNTLQTIANQTQGNYYTATNPADIANQLGQVTKDSKGQYILRWATLKRGGPAFMPSFAIMYGGLIAFSPTNAITPAVTNIDNTTTPPTTNITPAVTNFIIGYYNVGSNAGPVVVGNLRTVVDSQVLPTEIDLRTTYTPRYINQLRLRYIPNWPCTPILQSTNYGQILYGWGMTHTNDSAGTNYLMLSAPGVPPSVGPDIPFTAFGALVTFQFNDVLSNPSNAFAFMAVDNWLYTNTGGQSFTISNQFLTYYPNLPHGTPVPWLISYGYTTPPTSNFWAQAELQDGDGDGMLNWQEYRANTNPRDPNSKLVVNNVGRLADGRFTINFTTSTNRTYRVDSSLDLSTWQTVQDNIPGINTNVTIIDTRYIPGLQEIFYRVAVH